MKDKFYVPFPTAVLLKAKGYPQGQSDMYYGRLDDTNKYYLFFAHKKEYPQIIDYGEYAAPAYCEVIDWLVEKEIYIDTKRRYQLVTNDEEKIVDGYMLWYCSVYSYSINIPYFIMFTEKYNTREQAINAAIVRVLEEL